MLVLVAALGSFTLVPAMSAASNGCAGALDATTGNCSATIQGAIDAAGPGDVIVVAPGTYDENIVIPAGKDGLTLQSLHGAGATVIQGAIDPVLNAYNTIVDIASNDVTLGGDAHSGFTLTYGSATSNDQSQLFGVNIGANGNSGDVTGVTVAGNVIENLAATQIALPGVAMGRVVGVSVTESQNVSITDNTIQDISLNAAAGKANDFTYAVLFYGTNSDATVAGNQVTNLTETGGSACPGTGALGIAINDHMTGATVAGNHVSDVTSSCLSVGISVSASAGTIAVTGNQVDKVTSDANLGAALALKPSGASVTATQNDLRSSVVGVAISAPLSAGSAINDNNIASNGVGLYNASGTPVDATNNWWGCSKGPNSNGCDSIVDVASSMTTSSPYLQQPIQADKS